MRRFAVGFLAVSALASQGQNIYNPGVFDLEITFGCNCTCFCATNMDVTNTPVGSFLATNGVSWLSGTSSLAAGLNPTPQQYVPQQWALLDDGNPQFEGWTQTEQVPLGEANYVTVGDTLNTPVSPAGNFTTPIFSSLPPYSYPELPYNYYEGVLDPLTGGGPNVDLPEINPLGANQPYPWDVNVTMTLHNGQLYVMEQQLVIGPNPPVWGDPILDVVPDSPNPPLTWTNYVVPVTYLETNSLLSISLYCTNGGATNLLSVAYPTITATLLPDPDPYIPGPANDLTATGAGEELWTDDILTNWVWPFTPEDMPDVNRTYPGAAGTMQASLPSHSLDYPAGWSGYVPNTYVDNTLLLVRANRAYQITLNFYLTNDCTGNPFVPMPPIVITNTGLIPPCTNVAIVFYTGVCSACNPPGPNPCPTTNTGVVDMLGTPNVWPSSPSGFPSGITVWANVGTQPYYSDPLPGATVPEIYNLGVETYPPGTSTFDKYAVEDLGLNTAYEYFSSPYLSVMDPPCSTVDLSNNFVICPTNPGIVQGTVSLCGSVDTNYYGGVGALNFLEFAVYHDPVNVNLPYDPIVPVNTPWSSTDSDGNPDPTLANVSYIVASNGTSALSAGNGEAITEFDNTGGMTGANQYAGQYLLKLGGLQSEPSLWDVNNLHLVFGSPVDLSYDILETNAPLNVSCGSDMSNNINICFGLLTVNVTNYAYITSPQHNNAYQSISLTVSGTGPGYTIPPFFPANNLGTANNAIFQLFLPAGTYTIGGTAYNYGGGSDILSNTTYVVECGCSSTNGTTNSVCCTNCTAPYPDSYTVTVYPGSNFLADDLCQGTNNTLADLIPTVPSKTQVLFWDPVTGLFTSDSFTSHPAAWLNGTETLSPGEGFILINPSSNTYTLTFSGCAPGCPPPCGPTNMFSLIGGYGTNVTTWSNWFSCPPLCGTEVMIFNPLTQQFTTDVYGNGAWAPQAPFLQVGESAWVEITNGSELTVVCPSAKTVSCGTNWTFDQPTAVSCCTNNFGGSTGVVTNVMITSEGIETNGSCPEVTVSQTWSIIDACGNSQTCSQTVTVMGCCTNTGGGTNTGCCGPGLGAQTIQWLQFPTNGTAVSDASGTNPPGSWIVTNLPCYGNVLMVQDFPDLVYWSLNPYFADVPNANGAFDFTETGYGPYSWATSAGLLTLFASNVDNYTVTFYFLDGPPNPCNLVLGVAGLAANTAATVSQPVTFRTEFDLTNTSLPEMISAYTSLDGIYESSLEPGVTGTNVGSAYFQSGNHGDEHNTGWAVLQPASNLLTSNLSAGSVVGYSGPLTGLPYLSLSVSQQGGDGIGFTVGYICCTNVSTNCLQVDCATNKNVACDTIWAFDPPTATSCCTNNIPGTTTNVLITETGIVTNGVCPEVAITESWLITDACGDSNVCSQTVTVLGCCTNPPPPCLHVDCATNKNVSCDAAWAFDPPTATSCCTNNIPGATTNVLITETGIVTNGVCPEVAITESWLITDACGDSNVCSQTVTVLGCCTGPPPPCLQVDCATNKTVECGTNWTFDSPMGSTCCAGGIVHVVSLGAVTNGTCPKFATNTWAVYDNCGNSNTCSQEVTIVDTTPPMISCPSNIQVVSLNSNCQLVIPSVSVTASDTCTPYCSLVFTQNPTNGTIVSGDSATVTVTVTDLCGNSNSCEVLVEGVPKEGIKVVWPTNLVASNCVVPCAADFVHVTDCYCPESSLKITQSPLCGTPVGYGVNSVSVTVSDCNGMIAMKVLPIVVPGEESFMNVLTNTGVGANGALLLQNTLDQHYVINSVPTPPPPGYDYPYPVAVLNLWPTLGSTASTWIAPTTWLPLNRDLDDSAPGNYTYSYTFTLPSGVDPATASITGRWAADDSAILMTFNGWVTPNTVSGADSFHIWTPFSITTNFLRGQNQITFYGVNSANAPVGYNPTGLRVEFLSANVCGSCAPPYLISLSPSETLQEGSSATFSVHAGGTSPFSYQWEFNNAPIAGATASAAHISPVTYSNGGLYSVIISNPCGVVTGYIRLTVTQRLPWTNATWNIADVDNPLGATFGPDLFVAGTNYNTTLAIGAGTTEDFGLPDPGDQIVNVMSINPQAGTVIGMPPIVAAGSNSDNFYTLIMDVYEPDTSLGSSATFFESYVTNLSSGGQDGVALTLDESNYVHITVTADGTPYDYPSAEPMPVDSWNRIALVGQGPQADGTGADLSFYLNGISQIATTPCMCCTNWFYPVAWTNNTTTTIISSTNIALVNAVLYISDIQFHAIAMTPQMIAGIGSPASGSAPATLTQAGPSPVLSATMSNGVVNITWAGSPYVLQETSDLSSGVWAASVLPFTETTVNGNITTTATVTPSTNAPSKFYRQAFSP